MYGVRNFQCEPHHQHQNPAERKIQEVKKLTNGIMDRTGTQAKYWLLCLLFCVSLLNHLAVESLAWETPIYRATGQRPDISKFLIFHFNEKVLYAVDNCFPSGSPEKLGFYMGPAEHQVETLTHLVLTADTDQVIARSAVRKFMDPRNPNVRAAVIPNSKDGGASPDALRFQEGASKNRNDDFPPILHSTQDLRGLNVDPSELRLPLPTLTPEDFLDPDMAKLPLLTPEELVGLTFEASGRSDHPRQGGEEDQ